MNGEQWARISLRVVSERMAPAEVAEAIGLASSTPSEKFWAVDLTTDSSVPLQDQLREAKIFLGRHVEVLVSFAEAEIVLLVSWTPRTPQDGVAFDSELIKVLARFDCHILLDTYSDE